MQMAWNRARILFVTQALCLAGVVAWSLTRPTRDEPTTEAAIDPAPARPIRAEPREIPFRTGNPPGATLDLRPLELEANPEESAPRWQPASPADPQPDGPAGTAPFTSGQETVYYSPPGH